MILGDKQLVHMSVSACERNQDARVVLHLLDEQMLGPDGKNFLPVMVVEGTDGFVEFVPDVRQSVAEWFGADFPDAESKVDEINADRGFSRERALALVGETIERAAEFANP